MEIIKVVVDKLPKGCEDCLFKAQSWTGAYWTDVCDLEGLELYHLDQRPDWCPLVADIDVFKGHDYPPMKPDDGFRATVSDD